ncbi:dicarboxylate/amino acid:cation symporter [Dyella sp. C11]|uniref:dicarboxylate/amino acid:cation symporter n=1 Tax=Dyella sp. C11 TaxID=2126991 RepID=UPI000D657D03|nr:dicarboxylate/amino acid:cation symporter [Dyella sp. C11]
MALTQPEARISLAAARHAPTLLLVAATVLGVLVGWGCNRLLSTPQAANVSAGLSIITDIFLRLIKMIVAPLVFATLTSAVSRMGGAAEIGRVGLRTLAWFLAASCVSLALGMAMAHWLQPGAALHALPDFAQGATTGANDPSNGGVSLTDFVAHLVPRSIAEAMANNEILQVVLFSLLFGTAAASLKERVVTLVEWIEQLAAVMFRVTDYIMKLAPLAIFAALASSICLHGVGIVGTYGRFVAGFYLGLAVLWVILFGALSLIIGSRSLRLLAGIRQTVLLAFATSSSEAAYPRLLEQLVAFGIPRRIASFVLPLGYSFNLDGAMMYCTFAILFIAQAYGVELGAGQLFALFGLLLLSTKGLAGVPRAAIAVIAVTLPHFHLPDAGVALVLAVDHILDMGRSATNIVGNSIAAAAVSSWEKRLDVPPADEST